MGSIDTMFLEERRYPPPAEFAAQANAQPEIYDRDPDEFWETEARERVTWFEPFRQLCDWDLPYAKWFVGGKLNVTYNCVDRHVEAGNGAKVAYYWEGEPVDDRREITFADLKLETTKARERPEVARREEGHAGRHLHGHGPRDRRSRCSHARASARRTPSSSEASPPTRSATGCIDMGCEVLITQDEAWRRGTTVPLKKTADEAVAESPGVRNVLVLRRTGGDVPMQEGRDVLVARGRDRRVRVPVRADGRGGPALPPLHVRHDREAEGDRAHDRRLPRRRRDDAPLHLRREARLGVLVRRRRRLGHRPQLHRVRPALQRDDGRHVRRDARLPRQGPLVGDRRALQGRHPLHGADRDPHAHEVGAGVRAEARPVVAAPARLRRRADQSRGVGLVPRAHRRRPLSDRRHLVADGDGDDPDHAAARDHDAEAGLGARSRSPGSRSASTTSRATRSARAAAATSC